jgi:formylglycine-generating enzyme required for sulfatase activity
MGMANIFISYSSKDRDIMLQVAADLESHGHEVWLDQWKITGRAPYWEEIQAGVEGCSHFLYAISPDSIAPACGARKELGHATLLNKRIIPIMIVPVDLRAIPIESTAGLYQITDFTKQPYEQAFSKLLIALSDALTPLPRPRPTIPPPPSARGEGRKFPYGLVAGVALLLGLMLGGAFLLNSGGGDDAGETNTPAPTGTEVSQNPSETPSSTNTPPASDTPRPSLTPSLTLLAASPTEISIVQVVETLDAEATAAVRATNIAGTATQDRGQTLTVEAYTDTPTPTYTLTPNITASINAFTTQRAATQTADSFTDTPSHTPIPLGFPGNPVTANEQWEGKQVIQEINGVEMVLVPAGCFMMGSTDSQAEINEQPVHEQCFEAPFWIDRYEVTNAQFAAFAGVAGRASNWTEGDRPRESITWFEARDYCEKRGARLPTEAEWEYAARGPDNLLYPWGNDFVGDHVVYGENSGGETAPVGSRPAGDSWVGAADMSGNVWEWVSTLYQDYPYVAEDGREDTNNSTYVRVLRGGSWVSFNMQVLRAPDRGNIIPVNVNDSLGVRCAALY